MNSLIAWRKWNLGDLGKVGSCISFHQFPASTGAPCSCGTVSFSRTVTLWSNSCLWAQYRGTWVRLNNRDEEKVRPDDQWSFPRIEIKKKLLPLAGFSLWSNYTMGKYSWGLCKSPSILKHPPARNDSSTPGGEPGTKLSQRKQLWIFQN